MIIGMTNNRQPRPERIGTLRKGAKKAANRPGQDLEYFRFDPADPNDQELVAAFEEAFGAAPNHLEVYLPHQTASGNFSAWMEEYSASQLVHRCDGQTLYAYSQQGELVPTGEVCPYASGQKERTAKQPGCKQVGRLEVIIPALVTQAGRFGIVTVATTSIHDIINLSQVLEFYEQLNGGDLRGKPFVLSRVPKAISTPKEDGSRARRVKWLISLQPAAEWVLRQLQAPQRPALAVSVGDARSEETHMLATVDEETGEIIEATSRPAPQGGTDELAHITNGNSKHARAWEGYQRGIGYARDLKILVTELPESASVPQLVEASKALAALIRDTVAKRAAAADRTADLPEPAAPITHWVEVGIELLEAESELPTCDGCNLKHKKLIPAGSKQYCSSCHSRVIASAATKAARKAKQAAPVEEIAVPAGADGDIPPF